MIPLEEAIHFYLGCPCICDIGNDKTIHTRIIGIHANGNIQVAHAHGTQNQFEVQHIKPILRQLKDMSDQEAISVAEIVMRSYNAHFKPNEISGLVTSRNKEHQVCGIEVTTYINGNPRMVVRIESDSILKRDFYPNAYGYTWYCLPYMFEATLILVNKGFDTLGLIEAGEAIDYKTLQ